MSRVNVRKHFLKAGTVEVRAAVAVVRIKTVMRVAVFMGVFFKDLLLMGNAVAISIYFIITGQAAIQSNPHFLDII
ncbi:hypothetical protein SDC9_193164 [bioreactor metagenome]|uniref:Uncharacterized protein n=1 Tax=bioreactor metagenome TaxID=1076179 RepID=A0A645I2R7_9ZZZZ